MMIKDVNTLKWKEFRISDIFDIMDGYYNKKPPQDSSGTIPFLGATQYDNGITAFYNKTTIMQYDKVGKINSNDLEKRIFKGNCLAITNNGSVGNIYYQKADFTCSHDITPIYMKNKKINCYIAMFLSAALKKSAESFDYAKKWRPKRMKNSKVKLPTDSTGNLHWEFMESYMKNIEQKYIKKVVNYYNKKLLNNTGGGQN